MNQPKNIRPANASTFVNVLCPLIHWNPAKAPTAIARSDTTYTALESCGASQGNPINSTLIRQGSPRANTLCRIGCGVYRNMPIPMKATPASVSMNANSRIRILKCLGDSSSPVCCAYSRRSRLVVISSEMAK